MNILDTQGLCAGLYEKEYILLYAERHTLIYRNTAAWLLVAPPGTKRGEIIEYYVKIADERDDFDILEVSHGATGIWSWNDAEIMIEPDYFYDNPDFVQIAFAFQGG